MEDSSKILPVTDLKHPNNWGPQTWHKHSSYNRVSTLSKTCLGAQEGIIGSANRTAVFGVKNIQWQALFHLHRLVAVMTYLADWDWQIINWDKIKCN